jgi:hypothetical protein
MSVEIFDDCQLMRQKRIRPKKVQTVSNLFWLVLIGAISTSCSEAETPDAYYIAPIVNTDAGVGGGRGQVCINGSCNTSNLVCVNQNDILTCRLICDLADSSDPCGVGSICRTLDDDSGACFPGGVLDADCINSICDDGLSCTQLDIPDTDNPDGGTITVERCKFSCLIDNDGQPSFCPPGTTCRLFQGSDTSGVCL